MGSFEGRMGGEINQFFGQHNAGAELYIGEVGCIMSESRR